MKPDLFDVLLLLGLAALAAGAGCAAYLAGGWWAAAAGAATVLGIGFLTAGVLGKRGKEKLRRAAQGPSPTAGS